MEFLASYKVAISAATESGVLACSASSGSSWQAINGARIATTLHAGKPNTRIRWSAHVRRAKTAASSATLLLLVSTERYAGKD